jgi:murein DD-endopeptidase MepM/ murein hydrolase activator NlpD
MRLLYTLVPTGLVFALAGLAISTISGASLPTEPWASARQTSALGDSLLDRAARIVAEPLTAIESGGFTGPYFIADNDPVERTLRVGKGDTMTVLLRRAGLSSALAHEAANRLRPVYNPRNLRPGQEIALLFRPDAPDAPGSNNGEAKFLGLRLRADPETEVGIERDDIGGFVTFKKKRELKREPVRAGREIDSSLFVAAQKAGVPPSLILDLIHTYSYDVDFQRDIRPNDAFEALYERFTDKNGEVTHYGNILYASLTLRGTSHRIYRYTARDGETDYYDENGESVRKSLMKTPVDGARLSSRYGRRRHPVLGYTRLHRGIDFAAPRGTPIMAAGKGVVTMAGRNGGYGNYIRIRHNSQLSTAYAHLRRLARGVRKGTRVRQGQVIGYIGTTGVSTGPHLHYEILKDGRQVNPLRLKLPSGRKLKGAELERFAATRASLEAQFAGLAAETRTAGR